MPNNSSAPTITLHLTIFFWACGALFAKIIDLPAAEIIYLRSVPGFLVLTLLALALKKSFYFRPMDLFFGILIGLLTVTHWVTFYQSVQASTVALGLIMLYTHPVFTTLGEALIHRQRPNRQQLLLALSGLVGIALVSLQSLSSGFNLPAIGLGLISAILFASRNLFSKYLASHIPSLMQMWLQLLTAVVALGLFFGLEPVQSANQQDWLLLALLGVVFVALPHTGYLYALKHLGPTRASLMGMIQPVYAIGLAFFILDEFPTLLEITGGIIILGAASWATLDARGDQPKPRPAL